MSDSTLPSWRVRPPERARAGWGIPPKVWMILGGFAGSVALAALIIWVMGQMGPRGVPLIEPDPRPFRERPQSTGTPTPPPQETILERNARPERPGDQRLGPGPEQPRPEAMRAQTAPQPQPRVAQPAAPAPAAATPPAPRQGQPAAAPATPARPAAAPQGRTSIQLGALRSEEAARQEWDRLRARVPELAGRTPAVTRFEREGQPALWRLRVGGLADRDAARALCGQVQARGGACSVVGG
jgi:cell division septation protein DedD